MKTLIGAILTTVPAAPAAPALTIPSPLDVQVKAIIDVKKGLDGPGCAIGILKAGRPFLTVIDGAADIATHRPINPDTQFYSASTAKQFTALAVAQLVVEGKVNLDDDIRRYLPEMPRYERPVTVYMLLHHTGGIRDMLTLGTFAGYAESSEVTREDALRLVYGQTGTVFLPGSQHRYSNSGYLLLSEIVARASGMSFAEYMHDNVFGPLGMTRSRVLTGARATDPNSAHGYESKDGGFQIADTHPYYGGAGGLVLTLRDLAKYDRDVQVDHKVWTPAIAKIMLEPGKLADGSPAAARGSVYAAGLGLNGPWIQHGGAGEGFKNMMAWLPDGRLTVHVLCNNGAVDSAKLAERVVAAMPGYPSLAPTIPSVEGRYSSEDLPVIYSLKPEGDAKLVVDIEPRPGALGRKRHAELNKMPDGAFTGEGLRIVPDDDRAGFTLGDIRSRVGLIYFRREH